MKSLLGFGRRFGVAALCAAVALALAGSARATTYYWVSGGADGNWSTTGNWSGTAPSGTGAAADVMYFYNGVTLTDGANVTSIHDLGNPFNLRRVYLTGAGPASGSAVVTIQGNDLKLDASAAYEHVRLEAMGTNLTYNLNVNLIGSGGNTILVTGNGTAMFNFSGAITSGIASSQIALRKEGASTLRFPTPLTTEGKIHWVRATAGVLELANGFDLGTRGVYLGGGTVRFSGAGSVVGAVCNTAGGAIDVVEGLTFSLAPSQLTQNSATAGVRLTGRGKLLITGASGTATIGAYPLDISGTLEVGKNSAINSVVLLKMSDGGTFNTAGFDQTFASLTMGGGNSTIDLGAAASDSQLQFGDSSALAWTNGSVLTITNWNGSYSPTTNTPGTEYIRFSQTDGAGLTTNQAAMVGFRNPPNGNLGNGLYAAMIVTVSGTTNYDYVVPNTNVLYGVPSAPTATEATNVTATSFYANWNAVSGATNYLLDVATNSGFTVYVSGYSNRTAGLVTTYPVSGLSTGKTYYYRLRAQNSGGTSADSGTIAVGTTGPGPYYWVGGGANGNWSSAGNWSGTTPSGTGGVTYLMYFYNGVTLDSGANVTSIHDLGNPFNLKTLYLAGTAPASGSAVVTIQGNGIQVNTSAAYENVHLDATGTNLTCHMNANLIGPGANSIKFIGDGTALFNFGGSITSGIAASQIALRKEGSSTLRFPNPLTTEGKIHWVRATAGVIELANGFDLGTRGVYLGGGTVRFSGAGSVVGTVCNLSNGGGAIEVVDGLTFSLTPTQLTQNGGNNQVSVTGRGKLLITGASGTATIGAAPLNISGTLEVGKNNAINSVVLLKMSDGGTFNTAGFDQTFASLTMGGGNSTIDLGAAAADSQLQFGDSSALSWTNGSVLTITNWAGNVAGGGNEYVRFTGTGLTTGQLATIRFANPSGFDPGAYLAASVSTGGYVYVVPGAACGGGTVATPTFSPAAGAYTNAQSVTISTTTTGATVRYTTNGSTPSQTNGTVYSSPVTITTNTTLKAIAYKAGMTDSAVASGTYTIYHEYYVSTTGSDTNSGSQSSPFLTVRRAALAASSFGDTIRVGPGTFITYGTTIVVRTGVNIIGAGMTNTVLCGKDIGSSNQWSSILFTLHGGDDGSHELAHFTVRGWPAKTNLGCAFDIRDRDNIYVHDVRFESMNWSALTIAARDSDWVWPTNWITNVEVRDCEFVDCAGNFSFGPTDALRLGHISSGEVYRCTFDLPNGGGAIGGAWNGGYFRDLYIHDISAYGKSGPAWPAHPEWGPPGFIGIFNPVCNVTIRDVIATNLWMSFVHSIEDSAPSHAGDFWTGESPRLSVGRTTLINEYFLINGNRYMGSDGIEASVNHAEYFDCYVSGYFIPITTRASDITICNSVFSDSGPGVCLNAGGDPCINDVRFVNNVVCDSFYSMRVYNGKNMTVANNIFSLTNGGVWYAIELMGGTTNENFVCMNNFFYGCRTPPIRYSGTLISPVITNNITGVDPKMVLSGDKPSPWYSLQTNSPAIDAGVNVGLPYVGDAPDVGAYEYGAGITTDQSLMVQFVNPSGFTAGTYSPRIVPNVGIPTALAATAVGSSGFTASWTAALLATGYRLDVSTDADFSTFVTGYQDLNVGDVQTYVVSSLDPVTTYYYRVRAANANGDSANSNVIATQTIKNSGTTVMIR